MAYLLDHGIHLNRIGETVPVGEKMANQLANSAEELQRDRHVEFKILKVR